MKAFNEANTDIVKSAWTLFKVFFSKTEILNCTLNGKNGTKELCPVKKLAILRKRTLCYGMDTGYYSDSFCSVGICLFGF